MISYLLVLTLILVKVYVAIARWGDVNWTRVGSKIWDLIWNGKGGMILFAQGKSTHLSLTNLIVPCVCTFSSDSDQHLALSTVSYVNSVNFSFLR